MTKRSVSITHGLNATWVNDSVGYCIGRFGRNGIDVHMPAGNHSNTECLHCTHGPTSMADWLEFKRLMLTHYQVTVTDKDMPNFLHLLQKKLTKNIC